MPGLVPPAAAFDAEIAAAAHFAAIRPHEATAALDALATGRGDPAARALAAWERGRLALELGERKTAQDLVQGLRTRAEPNQQAAGFLVQALSESTHGNADAAANDAHAALKLLDRAAGNAALRSDALRLLARVIGSGGDLANALRHLDIAGKLAQAEHDPWREIEALLEQAKLQSLYRHAERAGEALSAARRVEQPHRDPVHLAELDLAAAELALQRGEPGAADAAVSSALAAAQEAGARALQARAQIVRAQLQRDAGQPAAALACAEAALDALESFPPGHPLRPLAQAQAGLAHVLMGHIAAGRLEVEAALQAADAGYYAGGPDGHSLLRQLDETLSRAGDAVGALEVYHREQGLRELRQRHDKEVALKDLQINYDSERKQREIDLLNRDNALKAAAVEASELHQRLLWLAAVVLGLGLMLAALLHWRLRALRLDLARRQTQLRRQSEHDALTGLANRRHFEDRMAELLEARPPGAGDGYEGTLFMLDIDQFKRVNERLGHAGGDTVLTQVAARIAGTVRSGDIAARWGGEEFVVAAPSLPAAQAEGLAERLLRAVGDRPIEVAGDSLAVTVSIGYAHFPLPPHRPALPWERALNLVDLALYVAKHRGRDRALGVTALHTADEASLQAVEAEFEPAWQDGRVHLHVLQRAAPTAENEPS